MSDEQELKRLYKLESNPFDSRVRLDSPIIGRTEERNAWQNVISNKAGARGCSLNFIIGDYGMGKSHSLYHIIEDCEKKGKLASFIIKLLPEDSVGNFGLDFIRRIFKNLDTPTKKAIAGVKKSRAADIFADQLSVIQRFAKNDPLCTRILTGTKVPAKELAAEKIKAVPNNTESALEFLATLLCLLNEGGLRSLVLCIDEAEYVFSQMNARKAAQVFYTLRAMYDLPETLNLGLKLQPIANIIFFFAISSAGMEKLLRMDKVEKNQGGPIQPLLTRIERKITLSRLSASETEQFIKAYLDIGRPAGGRHGVLIPYNEAFVKYVSTLTQGHPRSIMERCDYVIDEGLRDHVQLITKEYAKQVYDRMRMPS